MTLIKKAKELGRQLKDTKEYQELERTGAQLREDTTAQQVIQEVQDAQQKIEFSQKAGVQPSQEQLTEFQQKRQGMQTNVTIRAFMKAQEDFNTVMKKVNDAISEGVKGEDNNNEE
ncbi:MAG: YlbF family regulator [Firmicutes bacterium]|nr:YlbF family regulator [Bacillota bacterium]